MRLNDFNLFTANEKNVNCVQQCIEYLGYKYVGKSIEDTITDKKVVKYHPIDVSMDQVQKMDDLVMVYGFDNTTDCKNVVRVIECGDHMGLITKMWNRPIKNVVTNRKLNVSSTKKCVEIFVDIESFEDTNHNQVPYLICWQIVNSGIVSDVRYETMEGCVEKFVDKVLEEHKGSEIIMYAWYGSGYDYQHIFKYLKRHSLRDETFIRNNQIIYAKLIFNKMVIHLKDPYLFILCGLGKAAKAFGVTAKGEFPHQLVKGWGNLDEVLKRWYFIREDFQDTYDESGKSILITAKTWKEFEEGENHMSILQKAIEYCIIDVIAMQQIWVKFASTVKTELGVEIDVNTFTLSQLSMKLMLSNLPKGIKLTIPDRSDYDFIKRGIYGGRVVAKNGAYEEDILYADVVSLYPSAMRLLEHGYGHATKVKEINWSKHGIYEVELTCNSKPSDYMEFLPFRESSTTGEASSNLNRGGKLSYTWRSKWIGVYSTYDLLIAKDQGYSVKCLEGIEYAYVGYLFNNFIDKLFKLKSESTGVIRMVAKIALNGGGYGKFVQKPIEINSIIVPKTTLQQFFENEDGDGKVIIGKQRVNKPKFYDIDSDEWEKMVIESEGEVRYATQIGVSILSGSRYRLYMLIKQIKSIAPGIDIVYSDTDSIFIRKKSLGGIDISKYFGKQLGQLDNTVDGSLNNIINKIYIAGPKMYGYEYYDQNGIPQNTLRLKGVPAKMVTLDQLKHMVSAKNNSVIYSMMQMRKNIINVKNAYIDKTVKQT
ncbi:hypothetical protein COEREDRAFT_84053 [Coemansia reversa NRRL 1564]|uniref:Probable DNA polymerase n=1 Tax=Coemansia reversa (strain ATCC 12441 / NRRL 1564) TaxID=763665 RepID=A0A2G5B0L1_COERN|nr:hypothetical protein COEREDRAFT_84053 [Coemansia reversa NRRL 1564]|eukprot:PIA12550.1 hypothetical protein COEREDRAFT_84053 [Coemansia reversa NRRL 1564]